MLEEKETDWRYVTEDNNKRETDEKINGIKNRISIRVK